jgi:cation diffusion facilitator CzcD-associated flavoprotein CzcO
VRLRAEIRSARWEDDTQRWCLTTADGQQHRFNIIVSAVGLFTRPLFPDLVEEEPFTGTVMHSSRWDHSVPVEGARIAVLGTGSTASQLVPELAKVAGKVYSVQRSPTWILPKPDRHYTQRERWIFAHVPFAKKLYRTRLWLRSESNISVIEHGSEKTRKFTAVALGMLEKTVADAELRRKLTPDHPMGCKRLVFSSDYLPALTRPNVEVLNSPARSLRARSLVTEDGTERDVDVVVCATGYAAADYLGQLDVSGEHGTTLREVWREGAHAYFGMAVPGFPNFFMLYGPNTNLVINGSILIMVECQVRYAVEAIGCLLRAGQRAMSLRREVHERYGHEMEGGNAKMVWGVAHVPTWYRNKHGRVTQNWPFDLHTYWSRTLEPDLADYELA